MNESNLYRGTDIKDDGKTGLEEAIHALQLLSSIK